MQEPDRLDSWKQIAAYFGKSERTVRRWHETEGLPIHKHLHQQRGSVWAYKQELDSWLENRRVGPEPLADATPEPHDGSERPSSERSFWPPPALPVLTAAVLAVATMAVASVMLTRSTAVSTHEPVYDPIQITALPGRIYDPSFSPDGRRLVFFWTGPEDSRHGLYIKAMGDENVSTFVTTTPSSGQFVYSPQWAPDGKMIAFLRRISVTSGWTNIVEGSETWLCLMPAAGGQERRLIRLATGTLFYANNTHLSWSHDGQWLYAPMADGNRRGIHKISVTTAEAIAITRDGAYEYAPAISPDGKTLAFMRKDGPTAAAVERVFLLDMTAGGTPTGSPRQRFAGRALSSGMAWLPSSKELIFCYAASSYYGPFNSRLYRMSTETSEPLVPLGPTSECNTVAVSRPDASGAVDLVYAAGDRIRSNLFHVSLDAPDKTALLAPSSRFDALPSYSPDGSVVAFVSNRTGEPELWMAKPDGTLTTRLTEHSHIASTPRWSPDGKFLVYGAAPQRGNPYTIYTLPKQGGIPVRVPISQSFPRDPSWSPDGKSIYYWVEKQLWRVRPDGTEAAEIKEFPSYPVRPTVSDDGFIYYTVPSKPLALYRDMLETSAPERLADGLTTAVIAMTKRFVYYVGAHGEALYAVSVSKGQPRRIGLMPDWSGAQRVVLGFSVSSDDRTAVWAVTDKQQCDLYMVRNFR